MDYLKLTRLTIDEAAFILMNLEPTNKQNFFDKFPEKIEELNNNINQICYAIRIKEIIPLYYYMIKRDSNGNLIDQGEYNETTKDWSIASNQTIISKKDLFEWASKSGFILKNNKYFKSCETDSDKDVFLDAIDKHEFQFISIVELFHHLSNAYPDVQTDRLAKALKLKLIQKNNPMLKIYNKKITGEIVEAEFLNLDDILLEIIVNNSIPQVDNKPGKINEYNYYNIGFLRNDIKNLLSDLNINFYTSAHMRTSTYNINFSNDKTQYEQIISENASLKDEIVLLKQKIEKLEKTSNIIYENSSINDDDFISLKELINIITQQYQTDISETGKELLLIIRKYNILMYEYTLISGIEPYSVEFNSKARELLNLFAEGICIATKINNENYRLPINEWDSNTHRFPLYDKVAIDKLIIQKYLNKEMIRKSDNIILPKKQTSHNDLQKDLEQAKKEIEKLKKLVPILLGTYRKDDPLLIAIKIRNKEWSNYNEQDRRTRPTQDAICEDLKANYNVQTDQLAKAIELVSCPINRSK